MTNWSVYIEVGQPGPEVDLDLVVEFGDRLVANGAAVSAGRTGTTSYSAQLSVDNFDNAIDAAKNATHLFAQAAACVGLPAVPIIAVEVLTEEEFCRRLEMPVVPQLVGITEIAELADVSRQRASALQKRPGFPAPVASLRAGPVWALGQVTRFIDEWPRRNGRPKSTPEPQGPRVRDLSDSYIAKHDPEVQHPPEIDA